ncbi:MAG: hypothetical protein AMXMBFR33_39490 [Candidatus Xenobia bacterium]
MLRERRGILLITVIVLSVVMVMFVAASIALGPGNLAAGQQTLYQGQAQRAAESGISYALSQVRQNPAWRGNRNQVTINSADLYVQEDQGNVVGLVRAPDGSWSQFRLRFNYQDGSPGADGLDDPALTIQNQFVSINNLLGGASAPVPRADGPGSSVGPGSPTAFSVPIWAVSLAVEGRAGPACNQLNPGNLNPNLGSAVASKVVEAVYQIPDMGPQVQESGSMSGKDFLALLPAGSGAVNVTSNSSSTPRLRSKGEAKVTGGAVPNYVSPDGEVRIGSATNPSLQANYTAAPAPQGVVVGAENLIDPYYQLTWADVKKADPTGPQLAAGTYVWWDNGGGATLHYYDMSYSDYAAWISDPVNALNPGVTPPPLPPEVVLDTANKKLTITGSIYVGPTASTNELNVVARLGSEEAPPGDPEAAAGGDDAAIAAAIAADPAMLQQLLLDTQGGSADIDISDMSGNLLSDVDWDTGGFNDPIDAPVTYAMMLQMMANPTSVPGYQFDYSNQSITFNPIDLQTAAASVWYTGPPPTGGGGNNGVLNPPGVADTLNAADLSIEFAPPAGTAAVLTAEGNVRLTSAIEGQGGSITSGGNINITGLGANFAASQQSGVNMYAQGDIVFSTLDNNGGVYSYRDVNLKGVIYAQGDFIARLGSPALPGNWGKFNLEGSLIAYGGDPAGAPGANGKGTIDLRADEINLAFDSSYLGSLSALPPANFTLTPLSWANNF